MLKKIWRRGAILFVCLTLLLGAASSVLPFPALAASEEEAAQAAEVEAAIAAIKKVSVRSEAAILAAREKYDALSEEAKALVKNLAALETAERTLRNLKDRDAAAKIKKLSDAGKYDEAIALAEETMGGRAVKDVHELVVRNCLAACARKAKAMIRDGRCQAAEAYLIECRERYAGADTVELDRAEKALRSAVAEPESGTILVNRSKGEYGSVTVRAGSSPALIKLERINDPDSYLTFYVRAGETGTVHPKDGHYRLRYATGEKWYGEKELFGSTTLCREVDAVLSFSTDRVANDVLSQSYQIVLEAPKDGGPRAPEVSIDDF